MNNNTLTKRTRLRIINTNARSLGPKIRSLVDCFDEQDIDIATVTETWLQSNTELEQQVRDISGEHNLNVIFRNRTEIAANGRQYGGVAIVANLSRVNLKPFQLVNPDDHEVLAAVGTVHGIKGKVFCLAAYLPPNMPATEAEARLEYITDIITEAKRLYKGCTIIVAGDFNSWPAEQIADDHPDLTEVIHGPTRGEREIDRTFVNFSRAIDESGTLGALEDERGSRSDHKIAYAYCTFKKEISRTISYTYRRYTERGAADFKLWIGNQDWNDVFAANTSSMKARALQSKLEGAMDVFFPLRTTTKREKDPPWINWGVRRLIRKRRKVYDREGRSERWKTLKRRSDAIIKGRARNYWNEQRKTLLSPDAARAFYKNVKAYCTREKVQNFNIRELFPGSEDLDIAEKLADHFAGVGADFEGLHGEIPTTYSTPLPWLGHEQVRKRLVEFRKPKSMVRGDIFPQLVTSVASELAIPLTDIYNCMSATLQWPEGWKTEYVTAVPKVPLPTSLNDMRNISCTLLLSKVYESFLLGWIQEQVGIRRNQYGGMKGCGTEHFLVDLWQGILEDLEDPRAAAVLTSIDYSKAFNRLDWNACLKALEEKGASSEIIGLIASFLSGREMMVKMGSELSTPREVKGGVPQGSLLGVLLFNVTIDCFEQASGDVEPYDVLGGNPDRAVHVERVADAALDEVETRELPPAEHLHLPAWQEKKMRVSKYVDDNILVEKLNCEFTRTSGDGKKHIKVVRTQNLFRRTVRVAEEKKMRVNGAKTKLLCISDAKSYDTAVFFHDAEGNKIEESDKLKILGFHFSKKPTMQAQVDSILRGIRARLWMITHLTHNGFNKEELQKMYTTMIVPLHDYCSAVYHSSLTKKQSDALERLQARALKNIFGYQHSYRSLIDRTGLARLSERRDRRTDAFAHRCTRGRFSAWFPRNEGGRPTRHRPPFVEKFARCTRLQKSPLFHMRRRLNEMARTD